MKYILIDTNCWLDLLSPENEHALSLLEYWTGAKKILLLIPEQLRKEWGNQKINKLRSLIKVQNEVLPKIKSYKQIVRLENSNVEGRIIRIDELIETGKFIKPSHKVLAEVTRRFTVGEAPFHHGNNNSNSDALIYLTSVEFIKKQKLQKFMFVTRDADDFGDPKNPEKEIHPDLVIPGVETEYIFNIGYGIKKLQIELGDLKDLSTPRNSDYITQFQLLPPSQDSSILDKVYYSLKKYSNQIAFIPTDILVRIAPFKIDNYQYSYTYHSSFTIHSNNKELVELFKAIELKAKKKNNQLNIDFGLHKKINREKAGELVVMLHKNLIYEVSTIDHSLTADLRFKEDRFCSCVLCSYNRYDFISAFVNLSQVPLHDDLLTMKHAYVHFQFGNFGKSLQFFYSVYVSSIKNREFIKAFICLYNLKRLTSFIQGYYTENDAEILKIIAEVDKKSLFELELISTPEPFAKAIIQWILNTDFYNNPFKEISNTVDKIRQHYESQVAGGFSTNSNYSILLSHFAEIEYFLDQNFIIWNNYSDFEDLAQKFLEGLFTIHSFNDNQEERLPYIDDSLLILISKSTKREDIVASYKRVHLSGINSRHNAKNEPSLDMILLKSIQEFKSFKNLYENSDGAIKMFFWEKYRKIFSNLLLFVTLSTSQKLPYNQIFYGITDIIEEETFLRKFDDNIIAEFINEKGSYFESSSLEKFLQKAIDTPKLHEHRIFYTLQKIIRKHHPTLIIRDKRTYTKVLKNFFHECPKCKACHRANVLTQVFPILEGSFQLHLKKQFNRLLSKDFNAEVYYTAAIYGIIDFRQYLNLYLSSFNPSPSSKMNIRHPFNRGVAINRRLNEILNLAFKYEINLNEKEFQKYHGVSEYYDWLMNMDEFDYSKFDPLWILAYQTDIYLKKIFGNQKVIDFLRRWLQKSKHPYILELYIKYSG